MIKIPNILKFTYINSYDYQQLNDDEKNRFDKKIMIIYKNIPITRSLNRNLNQWIIKGLAHLVQANREEFICGIYVKFVDQLILKFPGDKVRCRAVSYKFGFDLVNDDDYYSAFKLFLNYYFQNKYKLNFDVFDDDNEKVFEFLMSYGDLSHLSKDQTYLLCLQYLISYFLAHNELFNNRFFYFETIMNNLLCDQSLIDYYTMNGFSNTPNKLPIDLMKRYEEGKQYKKEIK